MYKVFLKRWMDLGLALTGLLVLAPMLLLIAVLLSIVNKGNPLFLQPRPGKDGRVFRMIKFKTMNDKKDDRGQLLPDKERLSSLGALVRSCSLDELPNLINVVKGDMSLVGPRPLLVKYLALYDAHEARRHEVLPGITGWAQVNGRNALSWKEKFELDLFYVDHMTFWLDVRILCKTVFRVLKREAVNLNPSTTMSAFSRD
jgi:undecaprenyl phosphate N,N'-diacetylbacillosamine 1-phosphate transferase